MGIFPGQNSGSARSADGVGDQAVFKHHPFARQSVDVWGLIDGRSVCANGRRCMIIRKNEQNVGRRGGLVGTGAHEAQGQEPKN